MERDSISEMELSKDVQNALQLAQKRLELINCLSNTERNFSKRLYDGAPIWKRYREGELAAHFHFKAPVDFCLRWQRKNFGLLEFLVQSNQFSVPVRVGEFPDLCEFVPSVVRLKRLEQCEMFGDTFQVSGAVTFEALRRIFDRKLDALGRSAGLLLSKRPSDIVKCIAQAACELANANADNACKEIPGLWQDVEPELTGDQIFIRVNDVLPQPFQMFVCPIQQELDFLELIEHAASVQPIEGTLDSAVC